MNDPHVKCLFYKVESDDSIVYVNPDPLSFTNALGRFELVAGSLRIFPKAHYGTEDESRSAMESSLKEWEQHEDIATKVGTIRFSFQGASTVDRSGAKPSESRSVTVGLGRVSVSTQVLTRLTSYPAPPNGFGATWLVEVASARWAQYVEGNEPLTSVAYYVLTLLGTDAGGRRAASTKFSISFNVLDKIGELSSTRGSTRTARKAGASTELNGKERRWLEKAIPRVIIRAGLINSGRTVPKLGFQDLPPLS